MTPKQQMMLWPYLFLTVLTLGLVVLAGSELWQRVFYPSSVALPFDASTDVGKVAFMAQQPYQGYYGAWVQAVAAIFAGLLAIGGGSLAYFGAIRAGRFTLEAAQRQIDAEAARDHDTRARRARSLAETWYPKILDYLEAGMMGPQAGVRRLIEGAEQHRSLALAAKPVFLTMPVAEIEVMGIAIVQARTAMRREAESLEGMHRAARDLATDDPEARFVGGLLEASIETLSDTGGELLRLLEELRQGASPDQLEYREPE